MGRLMGFARHDCDEMLAKMLFESNKYRCETKIGIPVDVNCNICCDCRNFLHLLLIVD